MSGRAARQFTTRHAGHRSDSSSVGPIEPTSTPTGGPEPPAVEGSRARRSRARVTLIVGAVLGAAAVAFLLRAVVDQWSKVQDAIVHANVVLLLVGLALAVVSMAHLGVLWRDALALFDSRPPRRRVVVWWFVGELGKYVPGGLLSVVGRAEVARRSGAPGVAAYGSVPLSLVLRYMAAMLAFVVLLPFDLAHQRSIAALVVIALVPVGLLALHPRVVGWLLTRARRLSPRVPELAIPSWRHAITEVLAYVPNWVLIIASTWCTAQALVGDVSLLRVSLATLLSWTIGFLVFPVPAGAGLREVVFTASAGLPAGVAVSIAVASRLTFLLADGLGAAVCAPLLHRFRRQPGPGWPEPPTRPDLRPDVPSASGRAASP